MKISRIVAISIIVVSFILAIFLYPRMPEQMASHWNVNGDVDDYMTKFWGLFLMPIISLVSFILFLVIPTLDPLKKNIDKFRKYYDNFIVLFLAFMLYIYLLTIFFNLGFRFSMIEMMLPAFAVLFVYVGVLLENAKKNWFIGIRTPWTLSNDKVWDKTHKLSGKLFKLAGLFMLMGMFFTDYTFLFLLIPLIVICVVPIVYSYVEFKRIVKR